MALSILEVAANVRQAMSELDELCSQIRERNGEWTGHSLAGETAMVIAGDGLQNAWRILEQLKSIARHELARISGEAG